MGVKKTSRGRPGTVRIERFRRLAMALPEVVELPHWDMPSFRVNKKIFATIHEDDGRGMVKLTPDQQEEWEERDAAFTPVPGGWGMQGATFVDLAAADEKSLKTALRMAWGNVAQKRLTK